jgi:hypothetical protein
MSRQNFSKLVRSDYLKLVPILGLAFYLAFIPHQGFPFPVHVDEWVHLACTNELMTNGGTAGLTSPFSGGTPLWNQTFEVGFHLFWGIFQKITGMPWLDIIKYFPAIIFMLTVGSVYVVARREGFGWEAAFFTCLIPTTVGILGPGFLVPVAMGMLFIPLCIFVALNLRGWQGYLLLFIFTCFLVSMHGATAVCLVIILLPYILLNLRRNYKHSLLLTAALAVPFLAPFPWIFRLVLAEARGLFSYQALPMYVDFPRDFQPYGYLPVIFFIIGTFWLIRSGTQKGYALAFAPLALLAVVITFVQLHLGIEILYLRGFTILLLTMSIVAGCGLWWLRRVKLPDKLRLKPAFMGRHLGSALCLISIALILFIAIPTHQNAPYYHMIDTKDYDAFTWIADNVDESYDKAIVEPWKATAFTAVTGREVYAYIIMGPDEKDERARQFLEQGCTDTDFLRENGISIVYSWQGCNNPDLVEVRSDVYLLEDRD